MIKKISIADKAYDRYLSCKSKKDDFSLKDFFNFYKDKNISVFTEDNGIAILSLIGNECELYFLGIDHRKRNLGHGTKLLKKVIYYYKTLGTKKIFLEVNETNKVALKLYLNLGFTKYGTRKDYYKKELNSFDDAILMKLQLQT